MTSWLIVVWTVAIAWLSFGMLSNPELRRLDIFVGAIYLGEWWIAGVAVLTMLRLLSELWRWAFRRLRSRT